MIFLILLVLLLLAGAGVWIITIAVKSAFRPHILNRANAGYIISQLLYSVALALGTAAAYALDKQMGLPLAWYHIVGLGSIAGLFFGIKHDLKGMALLGMAGSYFSIGGWLDAGHENNTVTAGMVIASILLLSLIYDRANHWIKLNWIKKAYGIISMVTILGTTLFLTTTDGLQALSNYGDIRTGSLEFSTSPLVNPSSIIILGALAIAALAVNILFILKNKFETSSVSLQTLIFAIAIITWTINGSYILFSTGDYFSTDLSSTGVTLGLFYNISTFGLLLTLLWRGFNQRSIWQINLSLIALVLFVIIRYYDLLFAFLEKGLLFLTAGVLLLVIGYFVERTRKKLIARMEENV